MLCVILQVNTNGVVSFASPVTSFEAEPFPLNTTAMLTPFWGDIDTRGAGAGRIWYRQTSDAAFLSQARADVLAVYPTFTSFNPTKLLIATWDGVGHYDSLNSFSGLVGQTYNISE